MNRSASAKMDEYILMNPIARVLGATPIFIGRGRAELVIGQDDRTRDEDSAVDSAAMALTADFAAGLVVHASLKIQAGWRVKTASLDYFEPTLGEPQAAVLVVASDNDADWTVAGDKLVSITMTAHGPGTVRATGQVVITVSPSQHGDESQ